jgi:hypothetical protein
MESSDLYDSIDPDESASQVTANFSQVTAEPSVPAKYVVIVNDSSILQTALDLLNRSPEVFSITKCVVT